MILASHGIIGSSIGQIPQVSDADAQLFVNRVYTAGGVLSTTELSAVNDLVIDLKADGIWTKMKAIYPMVGASEAACKQNLKSSSFTGTFTSGWTFASTGATPNGTSAYMDTALTLNNTERGNSHISIYSRTNFKTSTRVSIDIGAGTVSTNQYNYIESYFSDNNYYYDNRSFGIIGTSVINSLGFMLGTTTSNVRQFKNGTKIGTATKSTSSNAINFSIYIGARNTDGTATDFSPRQCAFASIGDGLTDTEVSDFYTAVQAFQTTLSRQV
jgi:hypothetical protein